MSISAISPPYMYPAPPVRAPINTFVVSLAAPTPPLLISNPPFRYVSKLTVLIIVPTIVHASSTTGVVPVL